MEKKHQEVIAVVGHPVSHSLSPTIHSAAFAHLGMSAQYLLPLDLASADAPKLVETMKRFEIRQFAVTIPYKEIAVRIADTASEIAKRVGAANTLTRMNDGSVHADNTDWIGVRDSLDETGDWKNKKALVLGAGGAARGVIHALKELGMNISIKRLVNNRPLSQAEKLAQHFGVQLVEKGSDYDLIINVTPLGMKKEDKPENIHETAFDKNDLHIGTTVFDTVMNPFETRFLHEAKEKGCHTIDGMRMLVFQAIEQLRIWTEVVDPKLSHKVVTEKAKLAVLMRAAALQKLGVQEEVS